MDGFGSISNDTAQLIDRLRLMYNRLFVPTLQDAPTMQTAPDGGPVTAPTIGLYPTQKGSDMPRVNQNDLIRRGLRDWNYKGGGPA